LGFFIGNTQQGLLYGELGLCSFSWSGMLTVLTLFGFAVYLKLNPGQPEPTAPDILPLENPGEITIS
jgi:hypothetical protein